MELLSVRFRDGNYIIRNVHHKTPIGVEEGSNQAVTYKDCVGRKK